jgi:hypothetical protein
MVYGLGWMDLVKVSLGIALGITHNLYCHGTVI